MSTLIIIYYGLLLKHNINIEEVKDLLKVKTVKQAALHLKVPYNSLYNFCKKNALKSAVPSKAGRKSEIDQHLDEIIKLYAEGKSQAQIASRLGVCQVTIHNVLKKVSHRIRTQSEAARLRDSHHTEEELKHRAAMANAVRHAMGIVGIFNF